jgi:hypothetical protein
MEFFWNYCFLTAIMTANKCYFASKTTLAWSTPTLDCNQVQQQPQPPQNSKEKKEFVVIS